VGANLDLVEPRLVQISNGERHATAGPRLLISWVVRPSASSRRFRKSVAELESMSTAQLKALVAEGRARRKAAEQSRSDPPAGSGIRPASELAVDASGRHDAFRGAQPAG
jgi:hypothetical protein